MNPVLIALALLFPIASVHAAPSLKTEAAPTPTAPLSEREYRSHAIPLVKQAVVLSSRIALESSSYRLRASLWTLLSQMSPAQRATLDTSNYSPEGATVRRLHRALLDDLLAEEKVSVQLAALPAPPSLNDVGTSLQRFEQGIPTSLRLIRRGLGTRSPDSMQEGEKVLQSASADLFAVYNALAPKSQFLIDKHAGIPV